MFIILTLLSQRRITMSCNICCDSYNKSTRSKVKCPYCDFEVCRTCCETYILSETVSKCMQPSCAKEWSRKFLRENFTNVFLTSKYKEHLENKLFDQEKALLPATQHLVEEKIRKRNVKKQMMEIGALMEDLRRQHNELERSLLHNGDTLVSSESANSKPVKYFVRQCPAANCRGFLSSQWKCGICELWTCPDCHELKGVSRDCHHKCDPNNVETAKMLANDSKPCPKCQSLIFKISGCFAENTHILLWDGSYKMSQDITIGDILVGDDGEKRIVEDVVSGEDELYEIKQNNADTYIVNSKHMLALKFTGEKSIIWFESINSWKICWFDRISQKMTTKQFKVGKNIGKEMAYKSALDFLETLKLDDIILITVDDYLNLDKQTKNKLLGFKTSCGIHFNEQNISLDPYLLGLWLGDGTHSEPVIASNDEEIKNYIVNWCENNNAELVQESKYKLRIRRKGYSFGKENIKGDLYHSVPENIINRTNPFTDLLKKYNLDGNKHIPKEYLMNSREVRLKLLAGLIDTDGHVPKDQFGKRAVIIQTNETLSKQIIKLARSLGFVVNYIIRERKNVSIFGCEPKDYKNQYVINISGEKLSEIPTILPRKKCFDSQPNKDCFRTAIVVNSIGKGKYYGWTVDSNHKFLLDDFTVVKNCDQMWCTQCHTAFSWKTGKLEKHIHNPHYYEWQRKNDGGAAPRNPGDIECGRDLTHYTCEVIQNGAKRHNTLSSSIMEPYYNYRGEKQQNRQIYTYDERITLLCDIVRHMIHNIRAELPSFQTDYVTRNQDLRIKYLENLISDEDFKISIQRNDKKNRKNNEVSQVIQLANIALTDIIYRLIDHLQKSHHNTGDVSPFMNEISEIIKYCNNIFKDIAFTYNTIQYGFDASMGFIRVQKETKSRKNDVDDDTSSVASDDTGFSLLKTVANAANNLK